MALASLGAEPQSLKEVRTNREYIWNGDKEYWPRHAPVLFPMTGPTKDNTIKVNGTLFSMPNNGFARDSKFSILEQDDTHVVFLLSDNEETRKLYPFGFSLTVTYTLLDDGYRAKAEVLAKDDLYFTFGWHPGFNLDMNGEGTPLENYYVDFEQKEQVDRQCPANGVFFTEKDFLDNVDSFKLSRTETDKGPLILRNLKSKHITLRCTDKKHGVIVERGDMETFVIWTCAPKHAQYICLEPMRSFGDTTRPLELKEMQETEFLKKGDSRVFENSFRIF
jgi:galactose mutarotase-like enzyme